MRKGRKVKKSPERIAENMQTESIHIHKIPAVVFGKKSERVYLYIHGQGGRKEDTETVNGYRYEKGSDEAFTGTVKFKNGTTKEYKDGKVTSKTIYHENGQPASTKYKDENGRYYKKVEYDKSGNKIDEKVYE